MSMCGPGIKRGGEKRLLGRHCMRLVLKPLEVLGMQFPGQGMEAAEISPACWRPEVVFCR